MYERVVGVIVRPFGIRGEMKTRLFTDDPACLACGMDVQLAGHDGSAQIARISGIRPHQGHLLLQVEGVGTVEEAERWRGAEIRSSVQAAAPLDAGTYYTSDLIGMQVRHVNGTVIGEVLDVLRYPAQDLLVVGNALIPAVAAIVRSVSIEDRLIVVDPPGGLLPESEADQQPVEKGSKGGVRTTRRMGAAPNRQAARIPAQGQNHAL